MGARASCHAAPEPSLASSSGPILQPEQRCAACGHRSLAVEPPRIPVSRCAALETGPLLLSLVCVADRLSCREGSVLPLSLCGRPTLALLLSVLYPSRHRTWHSGDSLVLSVHIQMEFLFKMLVFSWLAAELELMGMRPAVWLPQHRRPCRAPNCCGPQC